MTEKIEGFYLDGTEYEIGGAEYNAGQGIEILNLDDYSAIQGPAQDGFHVPLNTEWQAVYDVWTALGGGSSGGTNFGIALKLPFAGYRNYSSAGVSSQGTYGYYWSSYRCDGGRAYNLRFNSTALSPQNFDNRTYGFSVRCFKNSPVVPMSSWTKLYGTSIESGGIFWSSTDGLISLSSDGQTWITIADKNLGATTVRNSGDTLSETNCGKYYQRGNNYGFLRTGSVTTSSTQVDASSYGPGNYYSSDTFIKYKGRWDTTDNGNLWGGETGVVTLDNVITNTGIYNAGEGIKIGTVQDYSAMQGPAPDRFHVPLTTEWQAVRDIRVALGGGSSDGTNFGIALKLPFAGYRSGSSANVFQQGSDGLYWSSSRSNENSAYRLTFNSTALNPQISDYRINSFSVRCFKNSPTVPTSSWTKLYGTSIEAGGIFWSSTDGLISLSSNGQNWITIADKNLGATQVWNSGDTLSEANCGKYYQRGNNYGFPFTGSVTTSGDIVDASNYGPGNYYSSNTFITRSESPYRWDSTDNGNLWGGETGVVTIENAIINTGVLSVNGQTGDVTVASPDMSNYLAKDNTTSFTPTGDYHPATKKYVDDNMTTKVFTLPSDTTTAEALTTAQEAYDWYIAGNVPVIKKGSTYYYVVRPESSADYDTELAFYQGRTHANDSLNTGVTNLYSQRMLLSISDGNVVRIVTSTPAFKSLLATGVDYTTPYTPEYDGSPATKKYVDDNKTEYTAGEGIDITNDEIGLDGTYEKTDYSAMQGPAPDGFHVPLTTEWQAVVDVWTTLGGGSDDGTNFGIALKLPFAGYRFSSDADVGNRGFQARYWSSSRYDENNAYHLFFRSNILYPQTSIGRAFGCSVRCFKNSPVVPTSSWTKLYGTSIEAGGIFWSSTDGLISLSSDGTTWITIQDKNLGATTVWNSGDTLSEANCGKHYQRGNNYGFSRPGTIANQSTTQVDASNYGPGNYYSSDTFIKGSGRWDTTDNGNLRGGETGVQGASGNLVLGDKLYKIVTSTSAPASGTASNIITIVTD